MINGRDRNGNEYKNEKRQLSHESIRHLYWECENTRGPITKILQILDNPNANAAEFLIGSLASSKTKTMLGCILVHWTKYWIYGRKVDNRIIIMREFEIEVDIMLRKLQKIQKFRDIIGQLINY